MPKFKILAIVAFIALFASTAFADVLPFQWSSTGSFSGLPSALTYTPTYTAASPSPVLYSNQAGDLNIILGTIGLSNISSADSGTFTLHLSFYNPDGAGNPSITGNVDLVAGWWFLWDDQVSIDFPGAQTVNFSGDDGVGTFSLAVQDFYMERASGTATGTLIGQIRNADIVSAPVPEPGSILLLCSMAGAVGLAARKRFRTR